MWFDFLQVCVVTDGLDPLLQRDNLVITSHHNDGAKFNPFAKCIGPIGTWPVGVFDVDVQRLERYARRPPLPRPVRD